MSYEGPERRAEPRWWSLVEHERFERRIRRTIWLMVVALSVVGLGVAFSFEEGCQRANEVRSALVSVIDDEIENLERLRPSQFPGIPRDRFYELRAHRIEGYKELRVKSLPRNCVSAVLPFDL